MISNSLPQVAGLPAVSFSRSASRAAFRPSDRRQRAGSKRVRILFIGIALALGCATALGQSPRPEMYQSLHLRQIGPPGNKVITVSGVPGDPSTVYAGTPSGGIFKSEDAGLHWKPIFDDQKVASMGNLAVARSDHNVVWVGTGDPFIRENVAIGDGIYRSDDAGKTWTHKGLEKTGRIGRVVIHPDNPDIVFVAAMGHSHGPQQERGVFRTRDGGQTWEQVLFVNQDTGAIDIVMDPTNPSVLFAATWQLVMHPWGNEAGGPGSGIYVSRDGGSNWTHLEGHGLPSGALGRIGLAIAPSNPNRIYALIAAEDQGNLWRSDDGGREWTVVSKDERINRRAVYFSRMAVLPDDPDELYILAQSLYRSRDGGASTTLVEPVFPDQHDIWIDPTNADRVIIGNDRYVNISVNRGKSWFRVGLPNAQIYRVATDHRVPYNVYGNRHDGPGFRGPSTYLAQTTGVGQVEDGITRIISPDTWLWIGGTETGWSVPDPDDEDIVWATNASSVQRIHMPSRTSRTVSPWPRRRFGGRGGPPQESSEEEEGKIQYRLNHSIPIAISPHWPRKVYVGSQFVHETTDNGATWTTISPDLTTGEYKPPEGPWPDARSESTLMTIEESAVVPGLIWAGSTDGLVHLTRNGGLNWSNVTANIPHLPPWGIVTCIQPSRHAAGSAYVTVDRHRSGDQNPYVFRTRDYGQSWQEINVGIPHSVVSYARVIREDPKRPGLLYLGTENALYVSFDEGDHWQPLQNNLPHVPVSWIVIQEDFNDLVISTFGRGFWILDDLTPLQELSSQVLAGDSFLFRPRPTYAFESLPPTTRDAIAEEWDPPSDSGHDAPYGAILNYYLKQSLPEPVKILIADQEGETIRTLEGPAEAGIQRVWWNLRADPTEAEEQQTRGRRQQPPVKPGLYQVKLQIGHRELTAPLTVLADPRMDWR